MTSLRPSGIRLNFRSGSVLSHAGISIERPFSALLSHRGAAGRTRTLGPFPDLAARRPRRRRWVERGIPRSGICWPSTAFDRACEQSPARACQQIEPVFRKIKSNKPTIRDQLKIISSLIAVSPSTSLRFLLPLRRLARLSLLYEVGTGPPHDRVRRPVLRSLWRTA